MPQSIPSRLLAAFGAGAVLAAAVAAPDLASAQPRGYYDSRHHYHRCVRRDANNGTAIGAVGGGLATGLLTHSVTGGLIGAAVGGVAGHQIAKHRAYSHC
jgi:uncharacterized protein YcfJ